MTSVDYLTIAEVFRAVEYTSGRTPEEKRMWHLLRDNMREMLQSRDQDFDSDSFTQASGG